MRWGISDDSPAYIDEVQPSVCALTAQARSTLTESTSVPVLRSTAMTEDDDDVGENHCLLLSPTNSFFSEDLVALRIQAQ